VPAEILSAWPFLGGKSHKSFRLTVSDLQEKCSMASPARHSPLAAHPPVLIGRNAIAARVSELGAQIDHDLAGESVLLVGVLKGAAIFLSDLARAISIPCTFDFVAVSSYGKGTRSSGAVKLIKDLDHPIEGRNIILVEDILDTGLTLAFLKRMLMQHRPRSLRVAALLDKPDRRLEPIQAEYVGFSIANHFVIGYGMDYAERFRNLPDICIFPADAAD
jgi:hypoxanthine phosphoribosyltransferase